MAQGYEIGCEAVDTRFAGSIPLAPLRGTSRPNIIRVCEELVMRDLFDPVAMAMFGDASGRATSGPKMVGLSLSEPLDHNETSESIC